MGKHQGVAKGASCSDCAGLCWDEPVWEETRNPRWRLTKDEKGQVLTRGTADPPFTRTLAVSEPVGRGNEIPSTCLAESVRIKNAATRARGRANRQNPLDRKTRDVRPNHPQPQRRHNMLCVPGSLHLSALSLIYKLEESISINFDASAFIFFSPFLSLNLSCISHL